MNEHDWHLLEDHLPLDSVTVDGVELNKGARVRLKPRLGGDVMDIALGGRFATIESIEQDYEGEQHLSVILEEDPGSDLGVARQPGHRFFFRPEEVELIGPAARTRIIVAGIGNIFMGDDAFGTEVAQRFLRMGVPDGVRTTDFGIRGYDLAYALTSGYDVAILVDATSRGGAPGTLYLIEPDLAGLESAQGQAAPPMADAHSMEPLSILRLAKRMGELPKRILVLGCEPATLGGDEGHLGLSERVEDAVEPAIERLRSLLAELLGDLSRRPSER